MFKKKLLISSVNLVRSTCMLLLIYSLDFLPSKYPLFYLYMNYCRELSAVEEI